MSKSRKATLPPTIPPEAMTTTEAARYLKIAYPTIIKYIHHPINPLPHVKRGHVWLLKADLDAYVPTKSGRPDAKPPRPGLLSASQAARRKGVHRMTLIRWTLAAHAPLPVVTTSAGAQTLHWFEPKTLDAYVPPGKAAKKKGKKKGKRTRGAQGRKPPRGRTDTEKARV